MSNFFWNPAAMDEALKLAGAGLTAATIFCTNQAKEILSVPAPRVRLTDKTGAKVYRAGFKLNDQTWRLSPYRSNQMVREDNYKFGKGGMGPAQKTTMTYRAAPAIKGDPPRKLSGNLRRRVTYEMLGQMKLFQGGTLPTIGRVGTNVKYARSLEFHKNQHSFLGRVVTKYRSQIENIIAETI